MDYDNVEANESEGDGGTNPYGQMSAGAGGNVPPYGNGTPEGMGGNVPPYGNGTPEGTGGNVPPYGNGSPEGVGGVPSYANDGVDGTVQGKRKGSGFGKGLLVGIFSTLLVMALTITTVGVVYFRFIKKDAPISMVSEDAKLDVITTLIGDYFYDKVDPKALSEGVYKGVVGGLNDPYSEYYTAEEFADFEIATTGNYAGIGAQLSQDKDTMVVTVVKVYDGSPAQAAGLRKGDLIVEVDGVGATEQSLEQFVQIIRGEEGTSLEMTYSRDGKEDKVTITRAAIVVPSVEYRMLDDHIGLIEISEFSSGTALAFEEAIADLESQGMESVIYDLRSNGGGLVDSVTEILDKILPEGLTVYMVDKNGEKTTYTSDNESQMDYPIVVLTSANTASAAEIFAGAIRDYEKGTLIGTKTYGKGVVQSTFPMIDGSAVKLTIATYYTPKGECIHGKGIEPDIALEYEYTGDEDAEEYDYSKDNQVLKAIEVLKGEAAE